MEADGAAPSSGGTNSPSFADRVRRLWSRAADPADPAEAAPSADSNLNLVAAAPLTDGGAAGDVAEAAGPAHPPGAWLLQLGAPV